MDGTLCQAQFDNISFPSAPVVITSPLPSLIYRWSFNETSGTVAHDSVGGADGTLNGSAAFDGNGNVVLNGTSGNYVSFPANLIVGLTDVTIEAWVTSAVSPDTVALFSFDDGLQDGVGGGYLRYVLHDQSNGRNFLELASGGGSPKLPANHGLGGQYVHVVCTYSQTMGAAAIYTNGVLEATMAVSTSLSNVSANFASLGRSPWNDQSSQVGFYTPAEFISKLHEWALNDPEGAAAERGKPRKRKIPLSGSLLSGAERQAVEKEMLRQIKEAMKRNPLCIPGQIGQGSDLIRTACRSNPDTVPTQFGQRSGEYPDSFWAPSERCPK